MSVGNKGNRAPRGGPDYKQGFRAMTPETLRRNASKGGKAAWAQGVAHRWTSEQAREAGRKGGVSRQARLRAARAERKLNNE